MVDKALLAVKLAAIRDAADRVRTHLPGSPRGLVGDRDARDIVALNLMVAIQECLSLAAHWLADEGRQVPDTYASVMTALGEAGVLDPALAERLGRAAGLRNLIAHQYARLDWVRVHEIASGQLGDLEAFCQQLARAAAGGA